MKKTILYLLLLAGPGVLAQYQTNYRELADKAFNNKDYYEASYYYEKAASDMKITAGSDIPYQGTLGRAGKVKPADRSYLIYQLAQSHRLYENYIKAKPWYYNILNENFEAQYPESRLWYGVCLRATGEFDEALKQLNQYVAAHPANDSLGILARKEIANCTFAIQQYKYPVLVRVSSLKGFNTDGSNYALVKKDGNSWFTSSRLDKGAEKRINRIYRQQKGASSPERISFNDDSKYKEAEYGTPSFHPGGKLMYLTRWHKDNGRIIHEILVVSRENSNSWGKPAALNKFVNVAGSSSMQPSVTADGKQLFYASDRQGGQGGYDIWVSNLDTAGRPTDAVNLGKQVNSLLDDEAPYFDQATGRLTFSSKGFTGLGGFDLFEASQTSGGWHDPVNLGFPINSSKDDIYYFPDESDKQKFYLSSDRESSCCLELFEVIDERYMLRGIVLNCESQKPVSGVKVSLQDGSTRTTEREVTTNDSGMYTFLISMKKPYNLVLERAGYFNKVMPVADRGDAQKDTLMRIEACLQPFTVGKAIVISNVLYDFNASELRAESKTVLDGLATIMKDNPQIKVELGSHTDGIGSEEYNRKLSQARAESCVAYIISRGISEDRIFAKGYGKSKPIAPNTLPNGKDNPEGRQLNRRTEFVVLSTGPATTTSLR